MWRDTLAAAATEDQEDEDENWTEAVSGGTARRPSVKQLIGHFEGVGDGADSNNTRSNSIRSVDKDSRSASDADLDLHLAKVSARGPPPPRKHTSPASQQQSGGSGGGAGDGQDADYGGSNNSAAEGRQLQLESMTGRPLDSLANYLKEKLGMHVIITRLNYTTLHKDGDSTERYAYKFSAYLHFL